MQRGEVLVEHEFGEENDSLSGGSVSLLSRFWILAVIELGNFREAHHLWRGFLAWGYRNQALLIAADDGNCPIFGSRAGPEYPPLLHIGSSYLQSGLRPDLLRRLASITKQWKIMQAQSWYKW